VRPYMRYRPGLADAFDFPFISVGRVSAKRCMDLTYSGASVEGEE